MRADGIDSRNAAECRRLLKDRDQTSMPLSEKSGDAVTYHTQLAEHWDQRYRKDSFKERLDVLLEFLGEHNLPGTAWLDAGCGTGTLSRWLAERGCNVLGVDASRKMLETAALLAQEETCSGRLTFEHIETIAQLELADSSMDGVLCSSVLEYTSDPNACLAEFARVLRAGGDLLVSVPNRHSLIRWSQTVWHRLGGWFGRTWIPYLSYSLNQYSVAEFTKILITHGFSVGRVVPLGVTLPPRLRRRSFMQPLLMFAAKRL